MVLVSLYDYAIPLYDALPSPKLGPSWALASKKRNYEDLRVRSQHSALKGMEGHAKASG
jgi:hypothetical protein